MLSTQSRRPRHGARLKRPFDKSILDMILDMI